MIYACTISFSTHREEADKDTEGQFTVLMEGPDVREVVDKMLPVKLAAVVTGNDDYVEFYLVSVVEISTPLRDAVIVGAVERALRPRSDDAWMDLLLTEDKEKARLIKYPKVQMEVPLSKHGRLPLRLRKDEGA